MRSFRQSLAVTFCVVATVLSPSTVRAGLYSGEDKEVTHGDLNSQDYWWARFDAMMMELAIQQHQPEGSIGLQLVSSIKRLDDLVKKYPHDEEIKKWKQHAEEVQAKIDANAPRGQSFSPTCPWEEANFAQLWVNLHWAPLLYKAMDYELAKSIMQNVMQNYDIMLKPDRMKEYPEDLHKWVVDNKPAADKLYHQIKIKLHEEEPSAEGTVAAVTSTKPASAPAEDVTASDPNSQDYWWAAFDAMMLEIAIDQHQPEGRISVNLGSAQRRLDDLVKKYPDNAQIKKWKQRTDDVQAKIDPNADRSKNFSAECPWDESNFAQLWVNFHWAKAALREKDSSTASSCLQNVKQNYDVMLKPGRMRDYPEALRTWVETSKPEADKLYAEVKPRRGRGR